MRTTVSVVVLGALAVVAASCAAPPTDAIQAAESALHAAETAEAPDYASEAYDAAKMAMDDLQTELQAQAEEFSLMRSYDRATELAGQATEAADEAEQEANVEKRRVRDETVQLIASAKATLEEARLLLAEAPRGKGTEADLAALGGDLSEVESSLQSAEDSLGEENFLAARDHAGSAQQIAQQVKASVEGAMRATRQGG